MRVTIAIDTGNAAFEGRRSGEVARILREYADKIEEAQLIPARAALRDANGNTVGSAMRRRR
jgi:hypothetical protein